MRKSLIQVAAALAVMAAGAAHAGLTLDLNGAAAGGQITADALDWSPTTILARGGGAAIDGFRAGTCGGTTTPPCLFEVMTHAKLIGYNQTGNGNYIGLDNSLGEITFVTRFTEVITGTTATSATFATVGTGRIEFYFSPTANSDALTGSGFNDGTLIGALDGVTGDGVANAFGFFGVTSATPVNLDNSGDGNQYTGQQTLRGFGSHDVITFGAAGAALDGAFFKTLLSDFSIRFENLSLSVPFGTTNPSDCFNDVRAATAVGTSALASECNTTHVNGKYVGQNAGDPGYLPVVGDVNFGPGQAPDFVAQSDPNSPVNGTPEPASLALIGLALAAAGATARRRK